MRHHLMAVCGFLEMGNLHQAEDYIQKICSNIDSITHKRFCENELVNLLCTSFTNQAERRGIRLTVETGLPGTLPLSDTELCAMISNGLENALNAVSGLAEFQRWVSFRCGVQREKLLIETKNPYCGKITFQDDLPVSDREGHGHGRRSIRAIAGRSQGLYGFKADCGIFILRIVLPI